MKKSVFTRLRDSRTIKFLSVYVALTFLTELIFPTAALALTSGPAQEEYASFEPATTTDLVNIYTGDFNYNIPLLSVPGPNGGYPINLAYHAGIGMEQEASWVGLGWNVNVGSINRQLRGLPDDVNGGPLGKVLQNYDMKPNETTTRSIPMPHTEILGKRQNLFNAGLQIYENNYKGLGYRVNAGVGVSIPFTASASLDLAYDSQDGFDITPSLSLGGFVSSVSNASISPTYNSNRGLTSITYSSTLLNHNSGFTFSTNHYVPYVGIPMKNTMTRSGFKVALKIPVPAIVNYGFIGHTGMYEKQEIKTKNILKSAFGYNYTQNATKNDLKDFNRKDIPYSKKVPNLAPSAFTYDIYGITGQGTGGMFRPYRSEIGILSDAATKSVTVGSMNAFEVGMDKSIIPPSISFDEGHDGSSTRGVLNSGPWRDGNAMAAHLKYRNKSDASAHPEFEPVYYQMYGSTGAVYDHEDMLYGAGGWGGEKALRVMLQRNIPGTTARFNTAEVFSRFTSQAPAYNAATGDHNIKYERRRRGSNIRVLTKKQAWDYGTTKEYEFKNGTMWSRKFPVSYVASSDDLVDQTSEITVYQADGMRYTYGMPAYNKIQKSATFRVAGVTAALDQGGSNIDENTTRVSGWHNGSSIIKADGQMRLDGFISENYLPPYAHSWLLTSMVSSDYLDLTGDGPSEDDLGFWVKFNYERAVENYNWRVPYADANYEKGGLENAYDDVGSYTYGVKEIFYLESVETKTHVALFKLGTRNDGRDANGEFSDLDTDVAGGLAHQGSNSLSKLESIKLYTKSEYGDIRVDNPSAVAIKEVHFDYSYELCQNVHNNIYFNDAGNKDKSGKLTLKKVYFTYNGSNRGSLTPYEFTYSSNNPDYDTRNMDRWGNYRDKTMYASTYPYADLPYTNQSQEPEADAWHLTKIALPNGGDLNIEYESDDYAYVENKKPMQMFEILGLKDIGHTSLADKDGLQGYRVYFKLPKAIPAAESDKVQYLKDHYFINEEGKFITDIYFNINTELTDGASYDSDRIQGYADMNGSHVGVAESSPGSGTYDIGYLSLKRAKLSDKNIWGTYINPLRKAAFQHLKMNRFELVNGNPANWVNLITGFMKTANQMFLGFNRYCLNQGWAHDIALGGDSQIRLYTPTGANVGNNAIIAGKYGGGNRVKKLYIEEADFMTGSGSNKYGQSYDYTIEEGGKTISSGVAYEPIVGMDESVLRQPIKYKKSTLLKAPQSLYIEKPILEDFYPSANVGYRKVTISSVARDKDQTMTLTDTDASKMSHKIATPVTVYEFYTAKDFPVITDQTDLSNHPAIVKTDLTPGIKNKFKKILARSQGYSIVLNDMAGKTKKVSTLIPEEASIDSPERILTETEYVYHTKKAYSSTSPMELSNNVQVLKEDGECGYARMGVTQDIYVDMNENYEKRSTNGDDFNFELTIIPAGLFPIFIPIIIPFKTTSKYETSFKTVVTNKLIYKTGILKEVNTYDGTKRLNTEYVTYDALSGAPVLSKTNNAYDNDDGMVYNMDFKGHWVYPPLRGNYSNIDALFTGLSITPGPKGRIDWGSGTTAGDSTYNFFCEGDELLLNGTVRAHVYDRKTPPDPTPGPYENDIFLVNENGDFVTAGQFTNSLITSIEVIHSGKKNMLTANVGSLSALKDPLETDNDLNVCFGLSGRGQSPSLPFADVFEAGAVTYSDDWTLACASGYSTGDAVDPYKVGIKGLWRPDATYFYRIREVNGVRKYNDDASKDGIIVGFEQFNWRHPEFSTEMQGAVIPDWVATNSISRYSRHGEPLEDINQAEIPSAALYGYGNSLVTAVASNATYEELIFDGFEDYTGYSGCDQHHWTMPAGGTIVTTQAHSGTSSYQLGGNQTFSTTIPVSPSYCDQDLKKYKESTGGDKLVLESCAFNGVFAPKVATEMYVSMWVKENVPVGSTTYSGPKCEVNGQTLHASGAIVDGWQKIEGKVELTPPLSSFILSFKNTNINTVYFDDFRMHPFTAQVKTFVYDQNTMKLRAELDNNNYATFYIYNDEGHLIKVNKETERGIKTLNEGRTGVALKN